MRYPQSRHFVSSTAVFQQPANGWTWANYDPERARAALNSWIGKRGDAVHRSKPINNGSPNAHLIKRDELDKVIRFIKELVKATDVYVGNNL